MSKGLVRIRVQDPSLQLLGIRSYEIRPALPDYLLGSSVVTQTMDLDGQPIMVLGSPEYLQAGNTLNFCFDPNDQIAQFDMVHTHTVVRMVEDWCAELLLQTAGMRGFSFRSNQRALQLYPYSQRLKGVRNAVYDHKEHALHFGFFEEKERQLFTCRSADIVAHKAGHVALALIKPQWLSSSHSQTIAMHESFGDVAAICFLHRLPEMPGMMLQAAEGSLQREKFFSSVSEGFCQGIGNLECGIRNADNDLTMDHAGIEPHELSKVFTGAFYDILVLFYELEKKRSAEIIRHPGETRAHEGILKQEGVRLARLLIRGILEAPDENATFVDVVKTMMSCEFDDERRQIIQSQFLLRGLSLLPPHSSVNRSSVRVLFSPPPSPSTPLSPCVRDGLRQSNLTNKNY